MELDTWNWVSGTVSGCVCFILCLFYFEFIGVSYKCCLKLQLCHVAIWGSIASWFIFLLIYCIPDIALYIAPHMIGQVWNCFLSSGNQCNDLMCGKKGYVSKVLCR